MIRDPLLELLLDPPRTTQDAYAFDRPQGRGREHARLKRQASLLDPLTERVWAAAGIAPGMRVLELGSGAGDVAMLAARAVGPRGRVVGVERDPEAVDLARARVRQAWLGNVSFVEGDISTIELDESFDAVVGRLVLMYVPDPAATLRHVSGFVRPGGIVCLHEIAPRAPLAAPQTPLFAEISRLICAALESAGASIDLAERLPAIFHAAVLAAPELRYERVAGGIEQSLTWWYRDLVTGLLPAIQRAGLATPAALELDTLADRLDTELWASGGIATLPPMIGAWSQIETSSAPPRAARRQRPGAHGRILTHNGSPASRHRSLDC